MTFVAGFLRLKKEVVVMKKAHLVLTLAMFALLTLAVAAFWHNANSQVAALEKASASLCQKDAPGMNFPDLGESVQDCESPAFASFRYENDNLLEENVIENTFSAASGNPAAVYCANVMKYPYKIHKDAGGGERGVCVMPDNEECDQWDFYAGTCGQKFNYCAQNGYKTATRKDDKDSFAMSYAVCLSPRGEEIGLPSELSSLKLAERTPELPPVTESLSGAALANLNTNLPASFDWRSYNGSNWLSPVKDQASCGGCWAFAAIGVTEAYVNIVNNNPNLDPNLSEQQLISCSGSGNCTGGSTVGALPYISNVGVVDEACMPYTQSNSTCDNKCSDWQSRVTKVEKVVNFTPTPDLIKQSVVTYGPTAVYMGIGSGVGGYFSNAIYRCTNDAAINHAVVIVGYDDVGKYWLVRNSWGSNWNGDGYFKVGYGECAIDTVYAGYAYKPSYETGYVGQSYVDPTMLAGQTQEISLTLKNGGTATWDDNTKLTARNPVSDPDNLDAPHPFCDATWEANCNRIQSAGSVAPGQSKTFNFKIKAPAAPGTYRINFGLVQEGVGWSGAPLNGQIGFEVSVATAHQVFIPNTQRMASADW